MSFSSPETEKNLIIERHEKKMRRKWNVKNHLKTRFYISGEEK